MNKLSAIWSLFRKGQAVANPEAWKDAGNAAFLVGGVILALVQLAASFGYTLPFDITTEQANNIGLGIATVVGFFVHNVSSEHAGLLPARRDAVSGDAAPGAAAPVQSVGQTHPGIDDATRERARKFLEANKDLYLG